ncbi:MAG: hypothetical protein WC713_09795 [Candidatus Methylomirabilota bacterium]
MGRSLRLHYQKRDDRYVWRHRVRDVAGEQRLIRLGEEPRRLSRWQDVGRRVPEELRADLWVHTRGLVLGIERHLDMRQDGRAVLKLVGWLLGNGLRWEAELMEMSWEGEARSGRVRWTFRLDGRLQRHGNRQTPDFPAGKYERDCEEQVAAIDLQAPWGLYTEHVHRGLVVPLRELDRRLGELDLLLREQRAAMRLYRHPRLNTWAFRQVQWQSSTTYLSLGDFDAAVGKLDLSPQERSTLEEARTLLQQRYKVRRLLRVIAELTEAGIRWPGGTWKVRGYASERGTIWHVASTASGTVGRSYA